MITKDWCVCIYCATDFQILVSVTVGCWLLATSKEYAPNHRPLLRLAFLDELQDF